MNIYIKLFALIITPVIGIVVGKLALAQTASNSAPCAIYDGGSWRCASKSEFEKTKKTAYCKNGYVKQLIYFRSNPNEKWACGVSNGLEAPPNCPSNEDVDKCIPYKRSGVVEAAINQDLIFVQQTLSNLGYNPGHIDGVMGSKTRTAIKEYQRFAGEPITGEITNTLVTTLKVPCQKELIKGVGYHRGACKKPEEVMPSVHIMKIKPGEAIRVE